MRSNMSGNIFNVLIALEIKQIKKVKILIFILEVKYVYRIMVVAYDSDRYHIKTATE